VVQPEGGNPLDKYLFKDVSVEIIFEDNHLLVIKKPKNVLTQKDKTNDFDLGEILKQYLKEKYNKPGNVFLGTVHRLDRPVGGVMVFTKTSKSASRISEQIRNGNFTKKYLALLNGTLTEKSGVLENYLNKDKNKNIVSIVDEAFEGAKKAVLKYNVLGEVNKVSLVEVDLITGRSHQIRIQFSDLGVPLLGDKKYGISNDKFFELCLWSNEISLYHPVNKKKMKFVLFPDNDYPWNGFSKFMNLS
jgi:23S rRNA pseudouridine1911/1915/1917 synthase